MKTAEHHHESWWLIESTSAPRPLYYSGHSKQRNGLFTMCMVEDANKAVRFPDEWGAKYMLAALSRVDGKDPLWPFKALDYWGYAVKEHIFDYTPLGSV